MLSPFATRLFLALLSLLAWSFGGVTARAAFIAEGAFDAATRFSSNYNQPYPPGPGFSLIRGSGLQTGVDRRSSGTYRDVGLEFALASVVASGQAITSATLTVNVSSFQSVSGSRYASVGLTAFGTSDAALTLGAFAGPQLAAGSASVTGTFDSIGYSGSDVGLPIAPITFDVTNILRSLLASGAASVGFVLANPGNNNLSFSTPDASNLAYRPELTITTNAVPAPPAAVLLLVGLLGVGPFACTRRR